MRTLRARLEQEKGETSFAKEDHYVLPIFFAISFWIREMIGGAHNSRARLEHRTINNRFLIALSIDAGKSKLH